MDELDRLTDAQEGTWNGSTITSETRQQEWTLSHTGNWDLGKLDLNGDGDWSDADEYEDARTHNAVNELTARDVDNDSTDDYTLSYDEVGNLIDDGENYKYVYDPFGRLRKVKNQSDTVVAEYVYNGLGFQISRLEDTDDDGDADASDTWFHTAFDEAWRYLSTFRADDSSPKDEVVPHLAGPGGYGGSSYINSVVLRDRDGTQANWLSAADGTMEFRFYYCQNWRGDVVALISANGKQIEFVRYTSYGIPIGYPGADTDTDGDCDQADVDQIQSWIDASSYDWRGDVDLDGDVDANDKSDAQSWLQGKSHGWEELGSEGNTFGPSGYCLRGYLLWLARSRAMSAQHGRWILRDPLDYVDGVNIYEYVKSNPGRWVDPLGSATTIPCPGYITDDDTYTDFATCDYYTYTGDAHHPYKTNADIKAECCEKLAHDSAETRAALLATGYECDEGYGPPSPSSSGATWCRKYHGVTDVQVLACRVESNVPTKVRGIRGLVTATALVVFEVKIEFFVACDIVEIEQPLPWPK